MWTFASFLRLRLSPIIQTSGSYIRTSACSVRRLDIGGLTISPLSGVYDRISYKLVTSHLIRKFQAGALPTKGTVSDHKRLCLQWAPN